MMTNPKPLFPEFENDGIPSFWLNHQRRKYRKQFVDLIREGKIKLEAVASCPCGGDKLLNISNKDRFGLPFRNVICQACGLLITTPRIVEESLSLYYKEIYLPLIGGAASNSDGDFRVGADQGEVIFSYCQDHVRKLKRTALKILEIGCSNGHNLIQFADLCKQEGIQCDLYGTEYEEANCARASRKGIQMISGGIEELLGANQKYDLIILSHIYEHLVDPNKTAKQLHELLAEDGILYVEVPGVMNDTVLKTNYANDFIDYTVHAHMYNFNLSSLTHIFNLHGFSCCKGDEWVRAIFQRAARCSNQVPQSVDANCKRVIDFLGEIRSQGKIESNGIFTFMTNHQPFKALVHLYYRASPLGQC